MCTSALNCARFKFCWIQKDSSGELYTEVKVTWYERFWKASLSVVNTKPLIPRFKFLPSSNRFRLTKRLFSVNSVPHRLTGGRIFCLFQLSCMQVFTNASPGEREQVLPVWRQRGRDHALVCIGLQCNPRNATSITTICKLALTVTFLLRYLQTPDLARQGRSRPIKPDIQAQYYWLQP